MVKLYSCNADCTCCSRMRSFAALRSLAACKFCSIRNRVASATSADGAGAGAGAEAEAEADAEAE